MATTHTVLVIEEQALFRLGVRTVLERRECYSIVGESITSTTLESICATVAPDLAIIGDLASSNALALARLVRRLVPRIAIIFLSNEEDEEYIFQTMRVGATAYAPRTLTSEKLLDIVCKVSHGEFLISEAVLKPHIASRVLQSFREQPKEGALRSQQHSPLSAREAEILAAISYGNSNKEIARLLKISDQTVKNHLTNILKKTLQKDRSAAVVEALKQGWIGLED